MNLIREIAPTLHMNTNQIRMTLGVSLTLIDY